MSIKDTDKNSKDFALWFFYIDESLKHMDISFECFLKVSPKYEKNKKHER